ncbi:SixA phosphatase family protein [Reichenbachiella versicolor]|uniref:SixA phosphatase family protein n=1 Tax=Reichenbachiella versicolor TaxID=1821036 RepID=UPI000D6E1820|nr:histidine phosphatase family protein [Reichenbachiella versicolor]
MKKIIVVRHAKSSWEYPELTDFERPLNKRGLRNAPQMAKYLYDIIDNVGVFYSSPAKRAFETAKFFAEQYAVKEEKIKLVDELYLPGLDDFESFFRRVDDSQDSIIIFSHNPGIINLVYKLTGENFDNIPTCGVSVISTEVQRWDNIIDVGGTLDGYYYPKGIK